MKWFRSRLISTRSFSFSPQIYGKDPLPQTVGNLQKIMASDHIMILDMKKEISRLKDQNQRLRDRLVKKNR
jgi:hypothetical protein